MPDFVKWEEIPSNLKIILMYHWFNCYSSIEYTEKDVLEYEKIAQTNYDKLFDLIVSLAITTKNLDSRVIIECIRAKKVDELLENTLDRSLFKGSARKNYENIRVAVLSELSQTYIATALLLNYLKDDNDNDDDNTYKRTP